MAAGRVRFLDEWAKLERIAVRKRWRGQGFAHGMVQVLLDEQPGYAHSPQGRLLKPLVEHKRYRRISGAQLAALMEVAR